MAFDITNKKVRSPFEFIGGAERKELTDQAFSDTNTTAAQDWVTARPYHRALVQTVADGGDAGVVNAVQLEVSDVSNFATGVDILDVKTLPAASATVNGTYVLTLAGSTQNAAGKRFSRIKFVLGVNASVNADIIFEAA